MSPLDSRRCLMLVWFGLLIFPGCRCAPEPEPFVAQPNLQAYFRPVTKPIQRVVVLPMDGYPADTPYHQDVRAQLIHELTSCERYEIVELPPAEWAACRSRVMLRGKFNEHELAALARRHHADAVLYGQIQVRRSYRPQALEVHFQLVDAREAVIASAVSGSWDLGRENDLQRFVNFHEARHHRFQQGELLEHSPAMFSRFVAAEVARSLTGKRVN